MDKRDYYEVLGVDRNADDDTIKRAYRKLAKQYHPDLNQGNPEAEEHFKEVNEAYGVLSNPDSKARYDRFGFEGVEGNAGAGGYEGFGSIFDMFFGGGFGEEIHNTHNVPRRGQDMKYTLTLTFEEAIFGCSKKIEIQRYENCKSCDGTGAKAGTSPETCPECHGTGQVAKVQQSAFGMMRTFVTCSRCHGTGQIIKEPCPDCKGAGKIKVTRSITVKIPAGIDNDQALPLRGEGHAGDLGGPSGDLYVVVNVKPHPIFERQGYDVYCTVPITISDAALGKKMEIPSIDGPIELEIPAGTQNDHVFRYKNRGIQKLRNAGRGDEYVTVHIEVPRKLTAHQRELLEEFDKETKDDAYKERKSFRDKVKKVFG